MSCSKICLAIAAVTSFLFFPDGLSSGERVEGRTFDNQSWNRMLQSEGWLTTQAMSLSVQVGSASHEMVGPVVRGARASVAGATFFLPVPHFLVDGLLLAGISEGT
jgi:hypothetical protein